METVCGSFPVNILWIDAFVGIGNLAFHDFQPVYLRVQCKRAQKWAVSYCPIYISRNNFYRENNSEIC